VKYISPTGGITFAENMERHSDPIRDRNTDTGFLLLAASLVCVLSACNHGNTAIREADVTSLARSMADKAVVLVRYTRADQEGSKKILTEKVLIDRSDGLYAVGDWMKKNLPIPYDGIGAVRPPCGLLIFDRKDLSGASEKEIALLCEQLISLNEKVPEISVAQISLHQGIDNLGRQLIPASELEVLYQIFAKYGRVIE